MCTWDLIYVWRTESLHSLSPFYYYYIVQCSVFEIRIIFSHWNYIQNNCTDCRMPTLRKRIHKSNKELNLRCFFFWFTAHIRTRLRYCYRFAISNQIGTQFENEKQKQNRIHIHDFAFRQGENKNINTWNYGHIQPDSNSNRFTECTQIVFRFHQYKLFIIRFLSRLVLHVVWWCLLCFWCTAQ